MTKVQLKTNIQLGFGLWRSQSAKRRQRMMGGQFYTATPVLLWNRVDILASLLVFLISTAASPANPLSDPAVDQYNVRVGTQTFAGLYHFTTNTLLVETAQAIQAMGSDIVKGYLGPDFPRQYNINLPSTITNLTALVRDEPSCHTMLDMPFRHFILWAYPLGNSWPFDGYSSAERTEDYREIYDLTRYFLTNYNNSGKSFYLGHWEGDWYLLPNYNTGTNPSPIAIQGTIDWLNNRQKAIDDAKSATVFSNVNVYGYTEVNRVRDAMSGDANINQRLINKCVPYVTNLDFVSYSSYDMENLSSVEVNATLTYMQSLLPTNKTAAISGSRIWVGEYGWGGSLTGDQQEPNARSYIQKLLNWGCRFALFWEIYNNETNNNFCLIDSHNVKTASYYLHQRFINRARLLVAQFKESNGRLPADNEFRALVTPILSQPLPSPAGLSVTNLTATLVDTTTASVSGTLAQGIYGDDGATVWVFWGRQDGGAVRGAWESARAVGVNTNFNPSIFRALIGGLVAQTNYFFRFYSTNANGQAWAPVSGRFSTAAIDPAAYGSRLKISFNGYNRSEPLLNFPVLVNLSTNLAGFSYRRFASRTGGDLRFADSGGLMPIPYEIDEWNTNGVSSVWVQLPVLAATNDCIWAYWGNPLNIAPQSSTTNGTVWTPDFELVWHLKESGFPYLDSTLKHPAVSGNAPAMTLAGVIGRGATFDGVTDFLNAGAVNLGARFTLSAWAKVDPTASSIRTIWANKAGGYNTAGFALYVNSYQTNDQKLILETGNGTAGNDAATDINIITFGQWHQVAATVDCAAGTAHLFVDGSDRTVLSGVRPDLASLGSVQFGCFTNPAYFFKGTLDEARIETQTRSSNWIWASWLTMASNAVLAAYSAITQSPPVLSATAAGSALALAWPAAGVGFGLYSASNLTAPVLWTPATNQPALLNTQWQVILPLDAASDRFYRLQPQ